MRTEVLLALLVILAVLEAAHPVASEETPDQLAASWLSGTSPFIAELLSNMSQLYVTSVGEEDFIPSGKGTTYNVTWYGKDAEISVLVTVVENYPVRYIAVLRINGSAPWYTYPTMIDVFEEVVTHYKDMIGRYTAYTDSGIGSYNRYWSSTYLEVGGCKAYVAVGKPAQVLIRLSDNDGIIELLIADQLGPLRDAGDPTEGEFEVSKSAVREGFCEEVCMVEDVWLFMNGSLRPVYVVRSFGEGEGSVRVIDASTGSVIYEDSWLNEELVSAVPKPLSMREIIINIAAAIAIAPGVITAIAVTAWYRMHPSEKLPRWAGALVIAALLGGLLVAAIIMVVVIDGVWSSACIEPPGGLYVACAEDIGMSGKVLHLAFSSSSDEFVAFKLVAWRGEWVAECVRCVFSIPPRSEGNVTVVFDGIPEVLGERLSVWVYGYPTYESSPFYLEWRRCG